MTDIEKIRARFDRIEGYIDTVYDATYSAVDGFFMGVEQVFTVAKRKALTRAYAAVGASMLTPLEKAYALADYYDKEGQPLAAAAWRKNIKVGLIDVTAVEKQWEQING